VGGHISQILQITIHAVKIQSAMVERNATVEPSRQMRFRIGINLGDVITMASASTETASTSPPVSRALLIPAVFAFPKKSSWRFSQNSMLHLRTSACGLSRT
jgi:hypothetical protein